MPYRTRPTTSELVVYCRRMSSPSATKLTLVGAGKIGQAIVQLLSSAPEFDVTVIDRDDDALSPLRERGVKRLRRRHHRPDRPGRLRRRSRHGDERRAVPRHVDHRHRSTQCRRSLLRSHRRRRLDAGGQEPGHRRHLGIGAAMRACPWFRVDRRSRPGPIVRRHPLDLDARRRVAAVPHQRLQVQPHLVDRRTDQRVLQPVRGDRRRQDARGSSTRRGRGVLARRRRLRGVQHLRRSRARCARPCSARSRR